MTPIIKGIVASGITGHLFPASSYESIQTVTVTSGGAASVTFSSIPQTYTHLQVRYVGQTARTAGTYGFNYLYAINGTTSNIYSTHEMSGDGSAVAAYAGSAGNSLWAGYAGRVANTYMFGAGVVDILDYTNTNKFKTFRSISGIDNNGSGNVGMDSGNWQSTAAITSFTLGDSVINWGPNSTFALYGIKVAS